MGVASSKMLVHPHLADKIFGLLPFRWSKWGLVQMGLVQLGLVQLGVIQMCTFTFTFLKASKVIIDFQYFTNNILSQFWWRFPILHKPFFLFGTESTMWLRKLKGWLVGVWDGMNLGWIPTGGLYPNFIPKSQWSGGVVQFCPFLHSFFLFFSDFQLFKNSI